MIPSDVSYPMATEWIDLPQEVLTEILSRLPAKSLLRFKSASKHWFVDDTGIACDEMGYPCYNDDSDTAPFKGKVEIYALSTDSWRQADTVVPEYSIYHSQTHRCTSSDGVFYWLADDRCARVHVICAFRMLDELFERIPLPENFHILSLSNFCLLKDSLALVVLSDTDHRRVATFFDVWVMDEYGVKESWTKKYVIGPLLGNHDALGFRSNVEVLLTRGNNRQMVSYDLSTHNIKEYNQICDTPGIYSEQQVFPYAESLISVKTRAG
ncbi:hypothetical protein RHMOL_Rhmol10G0071600 [Rhododendron molle]|uniref:Uncharacterized protein n=1 Tax=Rhododendron molle TaxID=49168 RepID=A0ACC0M0T4_RHOML|nr:hypothetical protein RHMOL_Rhmol10G0071600 [Rhododendron molle]